MKQKTHYLDLQEKNWLQALGHLLLMSEGCHICNFHGEISSGHLWIEFKSWGTGCDFLILSFDPNLMIVLNFFVRCMEKLTQNYSPKWWVLMVMNSMLQSVKRHQQNNSMYPLIYHKNQPFMEVNIPNPSLWCPDASQWVYTCSKEQWTKTYHVPSF